MSYIGNVIRLSSIHSFIVDGGDRGATLEEIAEGLGYTPQQVGHTLTTLLLQQKIRTTSEWRGKNLAGASVVYIGKEN